jgi:hypothetical protein
LDFIALETVGFINFEAVWGLGCGATPLFTGAGEPIIVRSGTGANVALLAWDEAKPPLGLIIPAPVIFGLSKPVGESGRGTSSATFFDFIALNRAACDN